jgi:hypothetical protein
MRRRRKRRARFQDEETRISTPKMREQIRSWQDTTRFEVITYLVMVYVTMMLVTQIIGH